LLGEVTAKDVNSFYSATELLLVKGGYQSKRGGRKGRNGQFYLALLSGLERMQIVSFCLLDGDKPLGILKPIGPRTAQLMNDKMFKGLVCKSKDMAKKENSGGIS
jgi:hypothetical protein